MDNKTIPFVYKIKNNLNNKLYIGAKFAKGCKPSDLGNTYFSSSIILLKEIELLGKENFTYEIIEIVKNKQEALKLESKLLNEVDALNNPLYYNNSNGKGNCQGLPKGLSKAINIITNDDIRLPFNELKNPLFTTISKKNPILKVYFNNNVYILTNRYLINKFSNEFNIDYHQLIRVIGKPYYISQQRRFDYLNGLKVETLQINDIDNDFICKYYDNFYNPYNYNILELSSEYYEYKDWKDLIKGKFGATIRSLKGFKQSEKTKNKMSNNNGIKTKKLYHNPITNERIYLSENDNIPNGFIKGDNLQSKIKRKKICKDLKFYHNPITNEQKRFNENNVPEGWIKGRIKFNNKINDNVNVLDIYDLSIKRVLPIEIKNNHKKLTGLPKNQRYNIFEYNNLIFLNKKEFIDYYINDNKISKDRAQYLIRENFKGNLSNIKLNFNIINLLDVSKEERKLYGNRLFEIK